MHFERIVILARAINRRIENDDYLSLKCVKLKKRNTSRTTGSQRSLRRSSRCPRRRRVKSP